MSRYKESWFKNSDNEENKTEFKKRLKNSEDVLSRLRELVDKRLQNSIDTSKLTRNYEDPNWALKQADYIGEQRAYQEILNLITINP